MCPIELQCPACCRDFRDDTSKWAEAQVWSLGAAEAREAEVGGGHPTESFCLQTWLEVASTTHQAVSSIDWKCPVGVYETHLDKGTPWLQDGTVLSVEVFKD